MRPCRSPTLRPQPNGISPALRRSRRSTSPRQVSRQTRTRTSSLRRPGPLPSASLGTRRRRGAAVGNSGAAALAGGTVGEYVEQIRRPRAALASASRTCPAPFPGVPSSLAKSGRSGQVRPVAVALISCQGNRTSPGQVAAELAADRISPRTPGSVAARAAKNGSRAVWARTAPPRQVSRPQPIMPAPPEPGGRPKSAAERRRRGRDSSRGKEPTHHRDVRMRVIGDGPSRAEPPQWVPGTVVRGERGRRYFVDVVWHRKLPQDVTFS